MKVLSDLVAEGFASGASAFAAGGGGSVTMSSVTIDFGANAIYSGSYTVTLSGATVDQKVMMLPVGDSDELEMDGITCSAKVTSSDTITVYITANPGPISNTRNFNILLG